MLCPWSFNRYFGQTQLEEMVSLQITRASFVSEIENEYVHMSMEVPRYSERYSQVIVTGSTAWWCWFHLTFFGFVFTGHWFHKLNYFQLAQLPLLSASGHLRDLALVISLGSEPLSLLSLCLLFYLLSPHSLSSLYCLPSLSAEVTDPILSRLAYKPPLSIWLVQIVLVGLKGHLKPGSKVALIPGCLFKCKLKSLFLPTHQNPLGLPLWFAGTWLITGWVFFSSSFEISACHRIWHIVVLCVC